jgi:diaminopimelate decarboxylase
MHDFHYKGDELFCEEVSIQHIVGQVGTPCYIYSHRTIHRHFHAFDDAFKEIPHIVAYAMKANSNIDFWLKKEAAQILCPGGNYSGP